MSNLEDSGKRINYGENGAMREPSEGKGDMYSLPPAAILRLSKHYESGSKKYARRNYMKGIPVSRFMDSALRHIYQYLDGDDKEDHLAAIAFNILGAMQMELRNKDMLDIPERVNKNIFEYTKNDDMKNENNITPSSVVKVLNSRSSLDKK